MFYNQLFSKFKVSLKISLATRLISSLLFISLHPSLAYAQSAAIENRTVVVAIVDQGVNSNHPALKNSMWINGKEIPGNNIDDDKNGFIDDSYGWNFLETNNNLMPKGGHGTKLAGLIAPNAKIMPLIVCSQITGCDQQAIINAIYYATDNGANVINLSLGDTAGYKPAYDEAIKYAYKHNVVLVASSGSASKGYTLSAEPMSPICNDNGQNMVLGVGTIDDRGNRPAWANYGGCIDVSAKGTNVYTTLNPDFSNGELYGYVEGNSFSTAEVSALAAQVIAQNPKITAADVIARIHNNANGKNFVMNANNTLNNQFAQKSKVLGASIKIYSKPVIKQPKILIR